VVSVLDGICPGACERFVCGIPLGDCMEPAALSARGGGTQARGRFRLTRAIRHGTGDDMAALHQFLDILLKPDNIPIAGMLVLVLFFTWVAFREALRNDKLIEQGRADEILKEMQK
jgi:hypothetical protein